MKRVLPSAILIAVAFTITGIAAAAGFPSRTITIISPAAAGGGTDLTARELGQAAQQYLGVSVIVKDMAGAANAAGINAGYQARPDGYTLVLGQVETVLDPLLGVGPWDPAKFTPVMGVDRASAALTVNAKSPWQTTKQFVDYAKAHPGVKVGGTSPGTIWNLAAQGFGRAIGADFNVIPYSGGAAPAIQDLLGNNIDAVTTSAGEVSSQAKAGLLRVLCLMAPQRDMVTFPDVPTCAEDGYDVSFATWWALMAPPNTPAAEASVLQSAFQKAWQTSKFQDFLKQQGFEPMNVTAQDFPAFIQGETSKFTPILSQMGLLKQ